MKFVGFNSFQWVSQRSNWIVFHQTDLTKGRNAIFHYLHLKLHVGHHVVQTISHCDNSYGYDSWLIGMIIFASHFSCWLKKKENNNDNHNDLTFVGGLYQTSKFSYIRRTRLLERCISAAQQCCFYSAVYHMYPFSKKCSFYDLINVHINILTTFRFVSYFDTKCSPLSRLCLGSAVPIFVQLQVCSPCSCQMIFFS